jgi:hypothetical protein
MSIRAGHPSLSPNASAWLAALSDPWARVTPNGRIQGSELAPLIEAASAHGVLPAIARNLQSLVTAGRGASIVDDAEAPRLVERASTELNQRLLLLVGRNLLLSHQAARIEAAFAREAISARVVKGPVFARRLYPQPTDRSFTDVDILIAPASLAAGFATLKQLGLVHAPDHDRASVDPGEYKWLMPGNDMVLVELQTDLIHSPNLGGGIRLRHADLLAAGDGVSDDATALLLVAAVHGAAGHQFERLQPVVDVLLAARGAAGPIDAKRLTRVADATGSTAAVQTALDLAGELFADRSAGELASALPPARWRRARRELISPRVVLRAQARSASHDSWRRRALREIIRRAGKATIQRVGD